ncbi:membrane protease subunit [Hyphomicrobium sp. xq]|uniref:Membrane protease subunit n=1 Tax=Hyphomicrobium album TaxID=2665159 RepID=A0A6I3KE87_9HYPH|nr:membrane protease subunit [Hyphomicrobium album]
MVSFVIVCLMLFVGSVAGCMRYGPEYSVWQQGMSGQAELARAEQNRQIKTTEARASLESAKLNAQAEVERAKGAAEANRVLADSLGGPDRYLRWRWIMMLETNERAGSHREIIYAPTDGNLPMTEAGRAVAPPAEGRTP